MLSIYETSYERAPELVIGLVAPIGTNLDLIVETVSESLSQLQYSAVPIRVSSILHQLPQYSHLANHNSGSEYDRIKEHMKAGTSLRTKTGRGDIMAMLAIGEIRRKRTELNINLPEIERNRTPLPRTAYILRSLKHPDEIETLRDIYGSAFVAISAYSPREERTMSLARLLANSEQDFNAEKHRPKADELINIDEEEEGTKLGQDVSDAFPLADLFIDARSKEGISKQVARFLDAYFGFPYSTPTRDEYAMFFAKSASLRSADLARQVGAVIATDEGDIIASGCNEVPKANGGLYWTGDVNDGRDYVRGFDSSTKFRTEILSELFKKLKSSGWLSSDNSSLEVAELLHKANNDKSLALRDAQIMNVIEYGRSVHAEMAALSDAAKRGVSVRNTTLYCTTFPCHLCARHIVASGISRVVYIEPYPKSQTKRLYPDSVQIDPSSTSTIRDKVAFEPFVGIAPSKYFTLFEQKGKRKSANGDALNWIRAKSSPHIKRFVLSYLMAEEAMIAEDLASALEKFQ